VISRRPLVELLHLECSYCTLAYALLTDFPGIDLNSFVSQMTKARSYKASSLVTKFLRDVTETRSSLSNIPGPQESPRNIQPSSPLLSFHSLLPGEPKECQTGLITNDVMLDAKFIRLLLFSITNGLAGLGDIPFASILRSLNKYENIEPLFMTVLRASPNHVAKSLAENLVKVAIEAQDSHIVKYLLDSQLLNINDLVCEAKGQKLTAVERAAQLRDCKTVEVLLAKHADVHKSYASIAKECGPLNLLINGFLRGETIPPDTLDLCNALFRRGAKVDVTMLERVLKESRNSDIALWLVSRFLETHETDLVRDGILPRIAGEMEEEEAYEAIKQILSACGRRHNGGCLQNLEGKVEMALVQSAKRGHVRTVQLLLPHTSDLHRVLSASFHSGQSEIVNLILAERPDFNTPAHRIDEEHWTEGHENLVWTVTTPLAEALRTRNAQWIQLCEDAGTLQHLHLTGNFGAALAAAATIGDLRYVQKLFNHRPEPLPEEMHVALVFSIENGHDDMSSLLIDAGAALYHPSNINSRQPPPLFAAVRQQNARVVRKILDAGTEYMYIMHSFYAYELLRDSTIMIELINWGDRTIISDFCYAFPAETTERVQVLKLRKGVMTKNLLDFLMDQGCLHERTLSRLLEVAIEENDTAMVDHLLKLGADPSKDHILCVAAKKMSRPDILDALLDHIPRRSRRVPGLGTLAIRTAIELGLSGLRMVDILIASEVVDIHGHVEVPPATTESPLGTAITMVDDFTSDFVVVKRLLKAGCDPNRVVIAELSYNLTALLAAVKTHNVDLVQVLLDHGAKVNTEATNRRLRTPLQAAAESGCLEVVQLLLKNNADVNALPAPRRGGTAFQLAATSGNCNIAAELLKHGADALMKPSFVQGRWPLEGAAENGRLDMISFLLRLNVYDADQCKRAVRFAEDNGHMGCKDLLLEHILQWESMSHFAASDVGRGLDLLA
jgi:ankyrin repeat protein